MTEKDREILRLWLAERDEKCPGCGYSLRGLAGEKCPECNASLKVRVGLSEPREGRWLAGLVLLAAGLGFNALTLFWQALAVVVEGGPARYLLEEWPLLLGAIVHGALIGRWFGKRRQYQALPLGAQRWWLVGCVVVTVGFVIAYFWWIRYSMGG